VPDRSPAPGGTRVRSPSPTAQPGALFRLMSPAQQKVLFENTARSIGEAPREIQLRHIGHGMKANPAYGEGVAKALGIPMSDVSKPR